MAPPSDAGLPLYDNHPHRRTPSERMAKAAGVSRRPLLEPVPSPSLAFRETDVIARRGDMLFMAPALGVYPNNIRAKPQGAITRESMGKALSRGGVSEEQFM